VSFTRRQGFVQLTAYWQSLNAEKTQKLDFYAESVVFLARNEICFVRKGDGFYRKKKFEEKRS